MHYRTKVKLGESVIEDKTYKNHAVPEKREKGK